jgi:CHAT domain-containing protein
LQNNLQYFISRRNQIQQQSGQLYQWLIEPFEEELARDESHTTSEVKRLTFVLDGALRNIPMSVLYDSQREQYLLERYAIAIAPSLQLLDARPTSRERTALVTGLSEEREFRGESFSSLPNVPKELDAIASLLPSQKLLNDDFILSQVQNQLQRRPYSIFHVATHGNFSSDPEDTYILLYDEQLQAREMNQLLRFQEEGESVPLELLVLSACETATGDRRAALGLAGIALRANTKSTLATLWPVDDESTAALMQEFYQELSKDPNLPKVEALRRAQLRLWENSDREWKLPFFWAPYILVGNWL